MLRNLRFLGIFIVAALATSLGWYSTRAQVENHKYFPETGHYLSGEFLTFYEKASRPALLYGYPITDAFLDPMTGWQIQYFQRARFELHEDAPAELRVQLTPLGQYLYKPGSLLPISESFPSCRSFPETGFRVCYAFLEFFNANGDVAQFGYPISNFEFQDQRIVQYFQRSRLEWQPQLPTGKRVVVSDLGEQYFDMRGENPILLRPKLESNVLQTVLSLKVLAFPGTAVTGAEGEQTIYIAVQDQNNQPVANAQVFMSMRLPSGQETRYFLPKTTNEHGITQFTFSFKSEDLGVARIFVSALRGALQQSTTTSFRLWW